MQKISVKPLFPRIAVETVKIGDTTEGGIALPETMQKDDRRDFGRIVALPESSPEPEKDPVAAALSRLAVGDVVAFPRQAAQRIEVGTDYSAVFVHVEDVLGVVAGLE